MLVLNENLFIKLLIFMLDSLHLIQRMSDDSLQNRTLVYLFWNLKQFSKNKARRFCVWDSDNYLRIHLLSPHFLSFSFWF